MDVKEIIRQAAEQEDKAYQYYMNALNIIKDPVAKVWIKELADEELKHKQLLVNFDISKVKKFKPDKIQDLHITEYLVDKDITEVKDAQDLLIVAMKKEQKSYNFYVSMAKSTDDKDIRKLCKMLAQEELKHKHKLELYYDDIVFQED
ncbi:MAG: ferritin family protein [Candidatus Loosdrechtia sp.]|uniref:ferritin family protein n=1 Tax=Candidatus Loosdrechtia sp. TaxID=3101272 RepID=UPI003A60D427|nr:MAG: ferritin family protein [Candidatus Jettenia sp. AMX2]